MNELTCREIDELLPGYAADALEEQERCAAAGHLAECRNHDAELQALRGSFASLATIVEPVEPPNALRGRLLDAFDRDLARPPAILTERPAPRGTRLISAGNFGYALAAGLLLIAIGLGVWGASRDSADGGQVFATVTQGEMRLAITYLPSEHLAVLELDVPELTPDKTYQAWQITDAGAVSLGLVDEGIELFRDVDLGGASAVALSIEPAGGSQSPTTNPLLVTPLSGG